MSLHITVDVNTLGRDFIVGDLHGMYDELVNALDDKGFDPKIDRLFSVGDLIDRGPDSIKCLELLNNPWFYAVQGNHERFMIDSLIHKLEMPYSSWIANGGGWTLDEDEHLLVKWAHRLESLPVTIQINMSDGLPIGVVHAEYPLDNWNERFEYQQIDDPVITAMLWSRTQIKTRTSKQITGLKTLYIGHTPTDEIINLGNCIFIDLGCYNSHELALVQIN